MFPLKVGDQFSQNRVYAPAFCMVEQQIQLWKLIRQPFRVPAKIHHCALCDWELIDCDVAGCLLCGKVHECKDAMQCPLVVYEGRHVCEITGFYTRRKVFVDDEFVDTVASVSMCPGRILQKISPALIETWVNRLLCSDVARQSIQQEMSKRKNRLRQIFVKFAKSKKLNHDPLNIVDLCTDVAHVTSQIRQPRVLSPEQLHILSAECAAHIIFFCSRFFEHFNVVLPNSKVSGFVVGFLYMMRHGLNMYNNIVIVPQMTILSSVLPSESQIKSLFHLSTKIMTEIENCVKITLRSVSREKLLDIGFQMV